MDDGDYLSLSTTNSSSHGPLLKLTGKIMFRGLHGLWRVKYFTFEGSNALLTFHTNTGGTAPGFNITAELYHQPRGCRYPHGDLPKVLPEKIGSVSMFPNSECRFIDWFWRIEHTDQLTWHLSPTIKHCLIIKASVLARYSGKHLEFLANYGLHKAVEWEFHDIRWMGFELHN